MNKALEDALPQIISIATAAVLAGAYMASTMVRDMVEVRMLSPSQLSSRRFWRSVGF